MLKFIKLFLIILAISDHTFLYSNNIDDLLKNVQIKPPTYYEPDSGGKYLSLSAGIIVAGTFSALGILYLMPESVTRWDKSEIEIIFSKWNKKTSKGPIIDNDEVWLNYIMHPYFGSLYYLQPRMAGFDWASSVFFSIIVSTFFWEYGVEAFAEVPSWQDIIITPAIGSLLGEGFYRLIRYIQMNNNELFGQLWLGKLITFILDPLGSLINDAGIGELFGIYNKNDSSNSKMSMFLTPILPNFNGGFSMNLIIKF